MSPFPHIARVPLTVKQPEACPYCGSHVLTRRGTRTKKLEIVQLWRCSSCKRVFTPGPEALRNKTYPLRMIHCSAGNRCPAIVERISESSLIEVV
jgi:transposase-like protein